MNIKTLFACSDAISLKLVKRHKKVHKTLRCDTMLQVFRRRSYVECEDDSERRTEGTRDEFNYRYAPASKD